jgi:pimeloyl-ACP methyl ester carboxylesterase
MKRRIIRFGCCLCIIFLTIWASLSPRFSPSLYSDALFKPQWGIGSMKELREFNKFENRELFFPTRDGGKLHGWLFINSRSNKIILFHPGNAGDIAKRLPIIEYLLESGASVFVYEPRGFGMSPGKPSIDNILQDGEAAYDHLLASGYKPSQIVLYGESLGAAVATHVSTQRTAAGIILQSGFSSLEQIGHEQYPALRVYPSWMFHRHRLDNADLMSKPHAPLLILHGDKDTLIGVSHGIEIARRAAQPVKFVRFPNSGHSDVTQNDLELFIQTVSKFISALP